MNIQHTTQAPQVPALPFTFQCPFTGQHHGSYALGVAPLPDTPAGKRASERVALALHPLLTAKLHPQQTVNLSQEWQIWRTLYALHVAGWLTYTAPLELGATHARTLCVLQEAGAALLREGKRTGRLCRLPAYSHGAECGPRSVANWLAWNVEQLQGGADVGEARSGAEDRYTTRNEALEAIKTEIAARIARKQSKHIALRASVDSVCDIMEDLSVQADWSEHHNETLWSIYSKRPASLPKLQACRVRIMEFFPQADVVGTRKALDAELVLQQLDALILQAAQAQEERAICEDETVEALEAITSVRNTYAVTGTERMDTIIPVGHSQSKSALEVADRLRKALAASGKIATPAPAAPSQSGMAVLIAKMRAQQAAQGTAPTAQDGTQATQDGDL